MSQAFPFFYPFDQKFFWHSSRFLHLLHRILRQHGRAAFYIFTYFLFKIYLQFFHGTAPKPSLSEIHQAIFGFDNEAQSETVRRPKRLNEDYGALFLA